MAVVRGTCSEWRSIEEGEFWFVLCKFERSVEGVDFVPEGEDFLLFFWEREVCCGWLGHYCYYYFFSILFFPYFSPQ